MPLDARNERKKNSRICRDKQQHIRLSQYLSRFSIYAQRDAVERVIAPRPDHGTIGRGPLLEGSLFPEQHPQEPPSDRGQRRFLRDPHHLDRHLPAGTLGAGAVPPENRARAHQTETEERQAADQRGARAALNALPQHAVGDRRVDHGESRSREDHQGQELAVANRGVRIVDRQSRENAGDHEQNRDEQESGERGAYSRTVRDGPG